MRQRAKQTRLEYELERDKRRQRLRLFILAEAEDHYLSEFSNYEDIIRTVYEHEIWCLGQQLRSLIADLPKLIPTPQEEELEWFTLTVPQPSV